MKKVKILKYVGPYKPNDVVEVDDEVAKQLCIVNEIDGEKRVRAMLLEDAEKIEAAIQNATDLTAAEAAAIGKKNIVETPKDFTTIAKEEKKKEVKKNA